MLTDYFQFFRKQIDDTAYTKLVQNIMKIHIGCARQRKEVLLNSVNVNVVQESSLEGDNFGVQASVQVHPPDKAYGWKVSLSIPAKTLNVGFISNEETGGLQKYFQIRELLKKGKHKPTHMYTNN